MTSIFENFGMFYSLLFEYNYFILRSLNLFSGNHNIFVSNSKKNYLHSLLIFNKKLFLQKLVKMNYGVFQFNSKSLQLPTKSLHLLTKFLQLITKFQKKLIRNKLSLIIQKINEKL